MKPINSPRAATRDVGGQVRAIEPYEWKYERGEPWDPRLEPATPRWNRMGFWLIRERPRPGYRGLAVGVPAWFLACLSAVLPAAVVYRSVRRHAKFGLCPRGGYDLRATPDRCPECGGEGA